MLTPDDRFIARELAIESHPHSREPDERMEPQDAQRNLVEQADQIVASFCVGHFMKQHSLQFLSVEQSIDARGKQDTRIQDAGDWGSQMPAVEAHRYTVRYEAGCHIIAVGRDLNLAALSAQTRDQSH